MHILHAKEWTMQNDLKLPATQLRRGQLLRVPDGRGSLVLCLSGTVWLTQDSDPRDIVLEAGDAVRIERDGLSIVSALSDASIVLSRDATRPHAPLPVRRAPAAAGIH
jgi:hypothetical protein